MKKDLQHKIDETLASLDGLQPATAPTDLWDRLHERIGALPLEAKVIPMRRVWQAAAAIALMIGLNIALLAYNSNQARGANSPATVASAYFSDPIDNY
jgi:hypothetical protein